MVTIREFFKCGNCKYFEPDTLDSSWGKCIRTESERGKPVHKDSLAVACDVEEFHAILAVHENFCCVMFTPRGKFGWV